jgi:D-sedoheptulose 7-phosphate isomerase
MDREKILDLLVSRYPALSEIVKPIDEAATAIIDCYRQGGKLLICGNGGSSSDSEHFSAELMKSFENHRPLEMKTIQRLKEISGLRGGILAKCLECGLPAIPLSAHSALKTAICNDTDPDLIFAQQVIGYGKPGDILIGISTSGNAQNVIDACVTARALEMKVIGLTGAGGGEMKSYCDLLLNVPEEETANVQELHLPVIHTICRIIENHFFPHPKK